MKCFVRHKTAEFGNLYNSIKRREYYVTVNWSVFKVIKYMTMSSSSTYIMLQVKKMCITLTMSSIRFYEIGLLATNMQVKSSRVSYRRERTDTKWEILITLAKIRIRTSIMFLQILPSFSQNFAEFSKLSKLYETRNMYRYVYIL